MSKCMNNISARSENNKMCMCGKFKDTCHTEPYLWVVKDARFRIPMYTYYRFRLSSHNLAIEVGDTHARPKIPRNERLCIKCNLRCVEDEIHFLLVCSKYNQAKAIGYFSRHH